MKWVSAQSKGVEEGEKANQEPARQQNEKINSQTRNVRAHNSKILVAQFL